MKANKINNDEIEESSSEDGFLNQVESDISHQIARKLKLLRTINGVSQAEIAKKMNISFQQFQKYEKGSTKISAARLCIIAKIFDIDLNFFFIETGNLSGIKGITNQNKMVMEDIKFISGYLNNDTNRNK